ncbi:hypothetical protein MMC26_003874 [Xylographa opegraphella]|nr:hypothetical protein [Xylographa opegraphella]
MTSTNITVKVGSEPYEISPTRMAYFSSFADFQQRAGKDTDVLEHEDIPLFGVAYNGAEHGFRQCFRALGTELDQYHILCDTLDFLCVDVLGGLSTDDLFQVLKSGKPQYELEYKYYTRIRSSKSPARDAAFRLLYSIMSTDFTSEVADSQTIYNAVLFIVSHRAIFKYKTRKVVRMAYEERFQPSQKQLASLDRWPATESSGDPDDDVTTEEYSSSEVDSDDYD